MDVASGGPPPHDPGMEARFSALEASVGEVRTVLGRLEPLLGRIDGRLGAVETRLGAVETRLGAFDDRLRGVELGVAELKGRVTELPTTIQVFNHMLGLLGGVVAVIGVNLAVGRFLIEH